MRLPIHWPLAASDEGKAEDAGLSRFSKSRWSAMQA